MNDKNKQQNQGESDMNVDQDLKNYKGGTSQAYADTDVESTEENTDLGDLEAGNYDQGPAMDSDTTDED